MPDTYPALDVAVTAVVAHVTSSRAADIASSPGFIDRFVQEEIREISRRVVERLCGEVALAAVAEAKATAAAKGQPLVVQRSPTISVTTVFGPIKVVSPYLCTTLPAAPPQDPNAAFLQDPAPRGARPVNDKLRVRGGGLTLQLRRVLADFGLDSSFEQAAAKTLEHYGLAVDRTTIRRVTLEEGEIAEREAWSPPCYLPMAAVPGPPMLVEMDGSAVRTGELQPAGDGEVTPKRRLPRRSRVTAWRDLRLGFVRRMDGSDELAFVGGILPLDEVADRLRGKAQERGWAPRTQTVRVTDGGHGVREALDRAFPEGRHILDRPHLHHHLHETAEAMGLTGDARQKQVSEWSARLARGEASTVITELAAYRGAGEQRTEQLSGYLSRFEDAVAYDEFQRLGYPIGSGEIESAHKGQVQARMKLPGTWWSEGNVNSIIALRLCRANGEWQRHWLRVA